MSSGILTCGEDVDGDEQRVLGLVQVQVIHSFRELEDGVDELKLKPWRGQSTNKDNSFKQLATQVE